MAATGGSGGSISLARGTRLVRDIRKQVEMVEQEILGPNSEEEVQVTVRTLQRMKEVLLQKIGEGGTE